MFPPAFPPADGSSFGAQFWPDLVATLIGAFVGIGLALRADHARERRARDAQEAALLRAARDAVQLNLELCAQLKVVLGQNLKVPTLELDVGLIDAILPRLVELSLDTALLEELNGFRYQLHHVNRKLNHMLAYSRLPLDNLAATLSNIGGSISGTIAGVEGSGQQTLLPLIEARLKHLDPPVLPWWAFRSG
ncbi:MAG TPA: hypothetical protein VN953_10875 [Gemmatimonadales bacterium]|nr:hypothetical protein [Gemmatimonadales bacterium]